MAIDKKDIKPNPKAEAWFKNVGKSLGYAAKDQIDTLLPTTMRNLSDTNIGIAKDVFNALRNKNNKGKIEDYLDETARTNIESIKSIRKNLVSSLKTGKFYDPTEIGIDDFDMDGDFELSDDFEFDMSEFSNNVDDDTKIAVPNVVINSNIGENNPMVKAVQQQTAMIGKVEEAADKRERSIAASSMMVSSKIAESINGSLSMVNDNLTALVNFQNEHTKKYIDSALNYHEQSLARMTEMLTQLKQGVEEEKAKYEKERFEPLDAAGAIDLGEYGKLIKKQFGSFVESNMFLSGLKGALEDTDTIKNITQQPLQYIPLMIVDKMIPSMVKSTLETFDKSIGAFIPAFFNRLNAMKESDNPLKSIIGSIFGIGSESKSSIDRSVYNRGAIPFDGVTKRSITEVIPGYLRKILAAISGGPELAYDDKKGKFATVSSMKEDFKRDERTTRLRDFDGLDDLKGMLSSVQFASDNQRDELKNTIDNFFVAASKNRKMVNPTLVGKTDGVSEFLSIDDIIDNANYAPILRSMIQALPKNVQMELFGKNHMSSRNNAAKFFTDEESEVSGRAAAIHMFDKVDEGYQTDDDGKIIRRKGSLFGIDKFGLTPVDYLRDISTTLLKGIRVFITKGNNSGNTKHLGETLDGYKKLKTTWENDGRKKDVTKELTDEEKAKAIAEGKLTVEDLNDIDSAEWKSHLEGYIERKKAEEDAKKPNKVQMWIKKILGSDNKFDAFMTDVLSYPGRQLAKGAKFLDEKMYEIIFGSDGNKSIKGGKPSFIDSIINKLTDKTESFFNWTKEKFFNPISNALIGKNGFFTKIRESAQWKKFKDFGKKGFDYLFGSLKDKNGERIREGGLFSGIANEMDHMWKGIKHFFTGNEPGFTENKEHSVFGEVKSMFNGFSNTMKQYFFGEDDPKDIKEKGKGLFAGIKESLIRGFGAFGNAIFGDEFILNENGEKVKNDKYATAEEYMQTFKERLPKSLATGIVGAGAGLLLGGKLGLLGSLFLPGGPIGGAILGIAAGFLSQSNRFKNWLFGEESTSVDDDGNIIKERVGGFISKDVQDFAKKHKVGIIGGAAVGLTKSLFGIGILPGMLGPVGGALIGMGSSVLLRSESFQNALFGEKEEYEDNGKKVTRRVGGLFSKVANKMSDADTKKKLGGIGAGAILGGGLGLVGSHFGILGGLAFGPMSGAIMGAAAGLAVTADKWKSAVFGDIKEIDGEKVRSGGLLTKFMNWTQMEVLQPLKIQAYEWSTNVQFWFREHIAEPFLNSLDPIKHEIGRIAEGLKEKFNDFKDWLSTNAVSVFVKENLFDPIIGGFNNFIFKPFKKIGKTLVEKTSKLIGSVTSMPFKMLQNFANRLQGKHEKQGMKAIREKIKENIKNSETVQEVKKLFDPIAEGFKTYLFDPFHDMINDVGSHFKKMVSNSIKELFHTAGFILTAPFRAVGFGAKGLNTLKSKFKERSDARAKDYNVYNEELLDNIRNNDNGKGKQRGLIRSVFDLVNTYNPFSTLSHDPRFSTEGASYAPENESKRAARARKRQRDKKLRDQKLAIMKGTFNANRELARQLGYDNVADDGSYEIPDPDDPTKTIKVRGLYDDIDKQIGKDYGKGWRKLTQAEKDAHKQKKLQNLLVSNTNKNTKDIADNTEKLVGTLSAVAENIKNGIYIKQAPSSEDSSDLSDHVAEVIEESHTESLEKFDEANDKEEEAKKVNEEIEDTKEEKQKYMSRKNATFMQNLRGKVNEKMAESRWKDAILSTLTGIEKTQTAAKVGWDAIFSKKGILTVGLLMFLPKILEFLKNPIEFIKGLLPTAANIAKDVKDGVISALEEFFGFGEDKDGDRTDATGNIQRNDDAIEHAVTRAALGPVGKFVTGAGKAVWDFGKTVGTGVKDYLYKNKNISVNDWFKLDDDGKIDFMMRSNGKKVPKMTRAQFDKLPIDKQQELVSLFGDDLFSSQSIGTKLINLKDKGMNYLFDSKMTKDYKKFLKLSDEEQMKFLAEHPGELEMYRDTIFTKGKNMINKAKTTASDVFTSVRGKTSQVANSVNAKFNNNSIVKKAKGLGNIIADKADDITTTLYTKVDDAFKGAISSAKNSKGGKLISKFIEFATKAIDNIGDFFVKQGVAITDSKLFSAVTSNLKKVLSPDILKKFNKTIQALLTKMGLTAGTVGTIDVVFFTYGIVSGMTDTETAHLFGIRQEDVTAGMKTASSLVKGFINTSVGSIIAVLNDICIAVLNVNPIAMLVEAVYDVIAGEDAAKALDEAQSLFGKDYNDYVALQQKLKGPDAEVESVDSYNDRINKSIAGKAFDGIKDLGTGVKNFFVGNKGNEQAVTDAKNMITQLEDMVKNKEISEDDPAYIETMKQLQQSLKANETKKGIIPVEKIKQSWGNFKDSDLFDKITLNQFDDSNIRKMLGLNDNVKINGQDRLVTATGSFINLLSLGTIDGAEFAKSMNGGIEIIKGHATALWDGITGAIDVVKDAIVKTKDDAIEQFNKLKEGITEFGTMIWESIVKTKDDMVGFFTDLADSVGETISNGIKGADQWISQALGLKDKDGNPTTIGKELSKKWDSFTSSIGKKIDGLKTKAGKIIEDTIEGFKDFFDLSKLGTNLKEFFTGLFTNDRSINKSNEVVNKRNQEANEKYNNPKGNTLSMGGAISPEMIRRGIGGPMDLLSTYAVNSEYGPRSLDGRHYGMDLDKPDNTPVGSFTDGIVVKVVNGFAPGSGYYGNWDGNGLGNHVVVQDKNGYYNYYGHMNGTNVKEGDLVKEGDQLGILGHTGNSTGGHLHYEIRKNMQAGSTSNNTIDPREYLKGVTNDPNALSTVGSGTLYGTNSSDEGLYGFINDISKTFKEATAPISEISSALMADMGKMLGRSISSTSSSTSVGDSNYVFDGKDLRHKPLNKFSKISVSEMNDWINRIAPANSPFRGKGDVFIRASEESGLDPKYIFAHAATESAYGTSDYAKAGNFFGIGAFDSNPDNAYNYGHDSMDEGLIEGAKWIARNYTNVGQDTLYKMRFNNGSHEYASDPEWANTIASIMGRGGAKPGPESQFTIGKRNISTTLNKSQSSNDKSNKDLLDKIIDVLVVIAENTGDTTDAVKELKSAAKQQVSDPTVYKRSSTEKKQDVNAPVTNTTNNTNVINPMLKIAEQRKANRLSTSYQQAKLIAKKV